LTEQKEKELNLVGMKKCTKLAQYTIYNMYTWIVQKDFQGGFCNKPTGTVWFEFTQMRWEGRIVITMFNISQLDLHAIYRVFNKCGFPDNYFVTGEDDKANFSIPGDILLLTN
jgi:hypothetical protein